MKLINRAQANLFIETARGKMIAAILYQVSLLFSSLLSCKQVFPCSLALLSVPPFVRAQQHIEVMRSGVQSTAVLMQHSVLVFLPAHSSVPSPISFFLFFFPLFCVPVLSCSPVSFVSAAVTSAQGGVGDAG